MKKLFTVILVITVTFFSISFAQSVSEALTDWVLGGTPPEIASGTRDDGTSGNYINAIVGCSPFYYEVESDGEGSVIFWLHDPGKCLENPDPGYGVRGPKWGLQNPSMAAVVVGIDRAEWAAGCLGYSSWTTVDVFSPWWFKDCLRGSHGCSFTPGWYKWTVTGTWDDISFTLHDVQYEIEDGPPHDDYTFGDCTRIYDEEVHKGTFAPALGEGWQAFHIRGDVASTGIENIGVQVVAATGVFDEMVPVSKPYQKTSWGGIKALYR